ncbi:hypothetical protein NVS89_04315 [Ancylobacter sp. MQZ15Z-1]|uniref:Uncharacterized protein n=1 Tax=Ancylobacter mangrovi TaxID=2972472 RepID=A0A9X2PE52_9HYPH|nr:hypothetical protein [Ancylobacter mangrovi]MCS0494310.1 hypothetical protein [Ancylobacter mangrovi]
MPAPPFGRPSAQPLAQPVDRTSPRTAHGAAAPGAGRRARWRDDVPRRAATWLLAAAGLVLLGAAIGLWARHGAAVFFDLMAAGFAYCI